MSSNSLAGFIFFVIFSLCPLTFQRIGRPLPGESWHQRRSVAAPVARPARTRVGRSPGCGILDAWHSRGNLFWLTISMIPMIPFHSHCHSHCSTWLWPWLWPWGYLRIISFGSKESGWAAASVHAFVSTVASARLWDSGGRFTGSNS